MTTKRKASRASGNIYILSNTCFPYLKIGFTKNDPEQRCKQLSRCQGVPTPFTLEYFAEVKCAKRVEGIIHFILAEHKVGREFFNVTVEEAKSILCHNFSAVGDELVFKRLRKSACESINKLNFD